MKIKELQKTVNIAWSPAGDNPIYLAAGTAAQQIDSGVNSSLEIFSTNFSDPSYDLALKASFSQKYRFQKLVWSTGLLVGGCEGGHVLIYSPSKMLAQEDGLLAQQNKHTDAVTGLAFNPFQSNLLASCASESEIFISDLNNSATVMTPGTKTQPLEDVKNVAWNKQVQHILASVFSSRCVIWDLRKSEQIIKLSDTQSRVRWHAVQWHPEVATQIWLASEDDQAPVVQMWDLRYATAPAKVMQIHQRGMLGMSWCEHDTDLMVSCGKDNRIFCWNPNTDIPEGEILSEVATTATWYSDVQWCPRNPALIASSSLDGNVSIYSLFGGTQQQVQTSNKIADSFPGMDQFAQAPAPQQSTQIIYHDLKRAPKWLKRPCGATFGFGGKLVHFNVQTKSAKISQVTTEPELVERASALERSLTDANFVEYCRQRADQQTDQGGRYLWYFLKANFETNPKEEMLNLLGYNTEDIQTKFSKFVKEDDNDNINELTSDMSRLSQQPADNTTVFDNIANAVTQQISEMPVMDFKIPSANHPDGLITEAILTGNIEAAVELCLESKRVADALIIASTAGIEFLTKTQNNYLKQQKNCELSNVISALVTRDWMDFVSRCAVDSWKEALVAALKHSDRKLVDICERLGDRLLNDSSKTIEYTKNALLCYVCAGSIDKFVGGWYQLKQLQNKNSAYKLSTVELQELAEVVMLMAKSLEQQGFVLEMSNGRFAEFISEYGGLLASQGAYTAALSYILALGTCEQPDLVALRERLNNTVNYRRTSVIPQQAQNSFARSYHQQARGSLSHSSPQSFNAIPTNQYVPNTNNWIAPTTAPVTGTVSMFNPAAQQQHKPPINDISNLPPRPLSTVSSQGGGTQSTTASLTSRSKYVLDPSVGASGAAGYGQVYNQVTPMPLNPQNNFNTSPFGASYTPGMDNTAASYMQPAQYNSTPFGAQTSNNYMPGIAPIQTAPPPVQSSLQNIQRNPTPPPGWNDPPALKSNKPAKISEPSAPVTAPITHPLFGVDSNQNGYMDPNAQYQQQSGMPPLPPQNSGVPASDPYMNPAGYPQNNNQQYMPQINYQNTMNATQLPAWNNQAAATTATAYTEQPVAMQRQPQPPKEKPPLPEEYIYMQTVLEELKAQCLNTAADPRTKRKFVDVAKRLENLYDCLRDARLTLTTVQSLNQIIQFVQMGDYANALQVHTQIAFGSDFAQCSGFMPGLKVLIQSATELQVYLR